ncbi:hypothetical protein M2244_002754 [Rhodoferax antarcticus]|nr:hypothetical protein RA876_10340 [Rhodoferax antarcticus]MCW2313005.1 hypothetical protein [Rhodoferax antarcticus]
MKTNVDIPEAMRARVEYERKFSLREMYRSFVFLPGAARRMVDNKNQASVDKHLLKRLQLAVTEVNGCAAGIDAARRRSRWEIVSRHCLACAVTVDSGVPA